MADAFTRNKFEWLDRIAADSRASDRGFRVAYVIASQFLSRARGQAWPSQATLAAACGTNDRRIDGWHRDLVGAGYLTSRRGGARAVATVRQMSTSPCLIGQQRQRKPVSTGQQRPTKKFRPDNLSFSTGQNRLFDRTAAPDNPLKEPTENPLRDSFSRRAVCLMTRQEPSGAETAWRAKRPIAPDWQPSPEDGRQAADQGLTAPEIEKEAATFRDHAPEQRRRCASWSAAWRNLVRKEESNSHAATLRGPHRGSNERPATRLSRRGRRLRQRREKANEPKRSHVGADRARRRPDAAQIGRRPSGRLICSSSTFRQCETSASRSGRRTSRATSTKRRSCLRRAESILEDQADAEAQFNKLGGRPRGSRSPRSVSIFIRKPRLTVFKLTIPIVRKLKETCGYSEVIFSEVIFLTSTD